MESDPSPFDLDSLLAGIQKAQSGRGQKELPGLLAKHARFCQRQIEDFIPAWMDEVNQVPDSPRGRLQGLVPPPARSEANAQMAGCIAWGDDWLLAKSVAIQDVAEGLFSLAVADQPALLSALVLARTSLEAGLYVAWVFDPTQGAQQILCRIAAAFLYQARTASTLKDWADEHFKVSEYQESFAWDTVQSTGLRIEWNNRKKPYAVVHPETGATALVTPNITQWAADLRGTNPTTVGLWRMASGATHAATYLAGDGVNFRDYGGGLRKADALSVAAGSVDQATRLVGTTVWEHLGTDGRQWERKQDSRWRSFVEAAGPPPGFSPLK